MSLTITEALAEVKTISKRLEKKRSSIMQFVGRDSRLKDPLESDGGSAEFVKRERQAVQDLEERIIAIRTAIQKVNLTTNVTIEGVTRTLAEWLTFRREVAQGRKQFLQQLAGGIVATRKEVQQKGGQMVVAGAAAVAITEGAAKPAFEIIVHLEEKSLIEEVELQEKILGDLDGKLSLLNATTTIGI